MAFDDVTLTALGTGALTFLGSVGTMIKMMWVRINDQQKQVEVALTECREEHKKTSSRLDEVQTDMRHLSRMVGRLEGKTGLTVEEQT